MGYMVDFMGGYLEDHPGYIVSVVNATPIYKPWKGHLEGVQQPDP